MRKRIIFLLITIILLTGCSIKKANYGSVKTIIDNVLYKEKKITNKNYEGYNVYIPQGLSVVGKSDNNIKIKDNNMKLEEIMMVGDQVVTDIQAANGAHVRSILVDKLVEEDQPTTRFNRIFDRIYRKQLIKKQLYKEWSEM